MWWTHQRTMDTLEERKVKDHSGLHLFNNTHLEVVSVGTETAGIMTVPISLPSYRTGGKLVKKTNGHWKMSPYMYIEAYWVEGMSKWILDNAYFQLKNSYNVSMIPKEFMNSPIFSYDKEDDFLYGEVLNSEDVCGVTKISVVLVCGIGVRFNGRVYSPIDCELTPKLFMFQSTLYDRRVKVITDKTYEFTGVSIANSMVSIHNPTVITAIPNSKEINIGKLATIRDTVGIDVHRVFNKEVTQPPKNELMFYRMVMANAVDEMYDVNLYESLNIFNKQETKSAVSTIS